MLAAGDNRTRAAEITDGAPGRMSREEMLMHVTIHSGYRRGQVGLIMREKSITPPVDGLTSYLPYGRTLNPAARLARKPVSFGRRPTEQPTARQAGSGRNSKPKGIWPPAR